MKSHSQSRASIADFKFVFAGYGHYLIYYTAPATGQIFKRLTDDMPLIDATKNTEEPLQADIDKLLRFVTRENEPE